jgi:seryl-tRNA synthetase
MEHAEDVDRARRVASVGAIRRAEAAEDSYQELLRKYERVRAERDRLSVDATMETARAARLGTRVAELEQQVEELREAAKETLGAWHGGTMNDVRAAMTLMEEKLKETEEL